MLDWILTHLSGLTWAVVAVAIFFQAWPWVSGVWAARHREGSLDSSRGLGAEPKSSVATPFASSTQQERRELGALKMGLFLFFFSTEFSRSFFPVFVQSFSVPFLSASMLMAAPQMVWGAAGLVLTPFGLWFSNRYGVARTLTGCAVVAAGSLAVTAGLHNYWVMLVARALTASAYSVVSIVAVIYLSTRGQAKMVALFLSALAAASICGNAVGGAAAQALSFSSAFWVSAGLSVLAAGVLAWGFRPTPNAQGMEKKKPVYRDLLTCAPIQWFALLGTMPYRLVLTGFVLYLLPVSLSKNGYTSAQIGEVMMLYFLLNAATVGLIAHWLDRHQAYRFTALLSSTGIALALIAFWAAGVHPVWMCLAVLLLSLSMNANASIQVPIVGIVFPRECERFGKTNIVAYLRTVERIGSVCGPFLAALLLQAFPGSAIALLGGVIAVASAGLALSFSHTLRQERAARLVLPNENEILVSQTREAPL